MLFYNRGVSPDGLQSPSINKRIVHYRERYRILPLTTSAHSTALPTYSLVISNTMLFRTPSPQLYDANPSRCSRARTRAESMNIIPAGG